MLANLLISQRFEGTGLVAAFNGLALLGKRCRGSNLVDAPLPEGAGGWDSRDGTMRQLRYAYEQSWRQKTLAPGVLQAQRTGGLKR